MEKRIRVAAVGLASSLFMSGLAMANDASNMGTQALSVVQPFVGVGLTFGGDKLATATFTNNDSESIKAGELFDFKGGFIYNVPDTPVSIQSSIGMQFDMVSAENGDISFFRYPLDILAFYETNNHRIGGGITYHIAPELEIDTPMVNDTVDFENALGLVAEYGYRFSRQVTVGIRYVAIDYEIDRFNAGTEFSGNHFGIYSYVTF